MNVGDLVNIQDYRYGYSAKGRIVRETETLWIVRVFAESTLGKLWVEQNNPLKRFYKKNGLSVGHTKDLDGGEKATLQNTRRGSEE